MYESHTERTRFCWSI